MAKPNARRLTLVVHNPTDMMRQEVVEVKAHDIWRQLKVKPGTPLLVTNSIGQEEDSQITKDGLLLFDASVRPRCDISYYVSAGTPEQSLRAWAYGKAYADRLDDIAFENDRTAYRIYGPGLKKRGSKSYGLDVFVKNTPDIMLPLFYKSELRSYQLIDSLKALSKKDEAEKVKLRMNYHLDHGRGHDAYMVGPTLGAGTSALMDEDQMVFPYTYETFEIIENGPLRFTLQLDFPPTTVGTDTNVVEHRLYSLDKGTNYTKTTVWYDGLTDAHDMVMGIVMHQTDVVSVDFEKDFIIYADPTDRPQVYSSQIYIGLFFPNGVRETRYIPMPEHIQDAVGHAAGIVAYHPHERYTYYLGTAWSKYDVRTFAEWRLRTTETIQAIRHPLTVTIQ